MMIIKVFVFVVGSQVHLMMWMYNVQYTVNVTERAKSCVEYVEEQKERIALFSVSFSYVIISRT